MKQQALRESAIILSIEARYQASNIPFIPAFKQAFEQALKKQGDAPLELLSSIVVDLLWLYLETALKNRNQPKKQLPKWLQWIFKLIEQIKQANGQPKEE